MTRLAGLQFGWELRRWPECRSLPPQPVLTWIRGSRKRRCWRRMKWGCVSILDECLRLWKPAGNRVGLSSETEATKGLIRLILRRCCSGVCWSKPSKLDLGCFGPKLREWTRHESVHVEFLETTWTWEEWARVGGWAGHATRGGIELIPGLN